MIIATLVSILDSCYKFHICSRHFLSFESNKLTSLISEGQQVKLAVPLTFCTCDSTWGGKVLSFLKFQPWTQGGSTRFVSLTGSSKIPFHEFPAFLSGTKSLARTHHHLYPMLNCSLQSCDYIYPITDLGFNIDSRYPQRFANRPTKCSLLREGIGSRRITPFPNVQR